MRRVRTALALGLGSTAVAVAAALSESPPTVLATNSTPASEILGATRTNTRICQAGERLPRGTQAIRLSLRASIGPRVTVQASSGARVITSGEQSFRWSGHTVTVPVEDVASTIYPAKICFTLDVAAREAVVALGAPHRAGSASAYTRNEALAGRLRIEYLGRGRASWLTLLPSVARHMAFGRAWSGVWIAFLVATLMLAAAILACGLIVGELDE
jgi:hypothetical protein